VVVDDATGELLGLEIITSESTEAVLEVVRAVAEQVKAEVLVSDDLDSYKGVANTLGLEHQICRNHVKRNVDDLVDALRDQLQAGEPVPDGVDSTPERLLGDVELLRQLVRVCDQPMGRSNWHSSTSATGQYRRQRRANGTRSGGGFGCWLYASGSAGCG
jgi:hypothetical protein